MSLSRRGSSSATRTVGFLVVMGTFRTTGSCRYPEFSCFRQEWQREVEPTALAFSFALRPDAPSVCFDESLTDCQSEPGSADHARHFAVDSMKPVEDLVELYGGHSQALVRYRNDQIAALAARRQGNAAPVWRVLYRVREKILHNLINAPGVRTYQRIFHGPFDHNLVVRRRELDFARDVASNRTQPRRLLVDAQDAGLQARQVEQIF